MLRLTDLTIRSFQSADPTTLRFAPDANLLLGINGAGKSTLLTLLSALAQVDLEWVTEHPGAIDLEWGLELDQPDDEPIRARLTLQVDAEAPEPGPRRRGAFGCAFRSARSGDLSLGATLNGDVSVNGERLDTPDKVDVLSARWPLTALANVAAQNRRDMSPVIPLLLATSQANGRLPIDEGLAAFDGIWGAASSRHETSWVVTTPGQPPLAFGVPRDVVAELFPDEANAPPDIWERGPRAVTTRARVAAVLGATDFTCHPRPGRRHADGKQRWEGFDLRVTWPDGSEDRAQDLSFGQKRIIAFFWTHGYRVDVPIFADELTNGLHAAWVDACVDALAGQQSFHAVQNPLLVDRLGPGSAQDLERRFVLCSVSVRDGRRRWLWRNPTEDEASALHHAYDGGLQHLRELLFAQGLW